MKHLNGFKSRLNAFKSILRKPQAQNAGSAGSTKTFLKVMCYKKRRKSGYKSEAVKSRKRKRKQCKPQAASAECRKRRKHKNIFKSYVLQKAQEKRL